MKLKILLVFLASIYFNQVSYAFFCPSNFAQIDFGMTIDQVTQACGNPTTKKEYKKENENVPQEWNYYIAQTVSTGSNAYQPAQGTLKTTVMFNADGKAVNMSVNGIGVGATQICGRTMELGNTRDQVKAACGEPAFKTKQTDTDPQTKESNIVEYVYSSTTPATTLVFENGKLTSKNRPSITPVCYFIQIKKTIFGRFCIFIIHK